MVFWIIQYVSIILDVRLIEVYSYLLVQLMHVKSVIITTVYRNNIFWNICTLRKCESNETEGSHYNDSRFESIFKNTSLSQPRSELYGGLAAARTLLDRTDDWSSLRRIKIYKPAQKMLNKKYVRCAWRKMYEVGRQKSAFCLAKKNSKEGSFSTRERIFMVLHNAKNS